MDSPNADGIDSWVQKMLEQEKSGLVNDEYHQMIMLLSIAQYNAAEQLWNQRRGLGWHRSGNLPYGLRPDQFLKFLRKEERELQKRYAEELEYRGPDTPFDDDVTPTNMVFLTDSSITDTSITKPPKSNIRQPQRVPVPPPAKMGAPQRVIGAVKHKLGPPMRVPPK